MMVAVVDTGRLRPALTPNIGRQEVSWDAHDDRGEFDLAGRIVFAVW